MGYAPLVERNAVEVVSHMTHTKRERERERETVPARELDNVARGVDLASSRGTTLHTERERPVRSERCLA